MHGTTMKERFELHLFLIPLYLTACSSIIDEHRVRAEEKLSPAIIEIISRPQFKHAHWGILVSDLKSGAVIYELNADKLFAPASTTKLYSTAAALHYLGADYRFQTPIYRRGDVDSRGRLKGDLILVASGDLTMGGRTDNKGMVSFCDHDHTYADSNNSTELTTTNPLAGLDELARQVRMAGVSSIAGQILVDARRFDVAKSTGSGPSLVTPILINDNVIDIMVTPSKTGSPALVDWRPRAAYFDVQAAVKTAKAGSPIRLEIDQIAKNAIVIRGQIAADHKPAIRVHEVQDPSQWARGLLIEAMERAGIEVAASPGDENRTDLLPDWSGYKDLDAWRSWNRRPFPTTFD